jgi:xanthine dehydrogenase small subunit
MITVSLSGNLCHCIGYKPIIDSATKACAKPESINKMNSAEF